MYTEVLQWQVIPLLPKSKIPFMKEWNKSYDQAKIKKYVSENKCNIGLRLGNVIDVEADTERANNLLNRLVRDYPHPMYKSQKSIHHLFINPDIELTRITIHGIEFRGNLHQSVLPPSINQNNIQYTWLEDSKFPVPPLPEPLLNLYNKHRKMMLKSRLKNMVQPECSKCKKESRPVHPSRYKLEVKAFASMNEKWLCHQCRKVIEKDIRGVCRKIRRSGISIK